MASPMICATVMTTEPTPLMMEAMDGAAAVIVCKMTGTTVCVIKLNMLSMIDRTVVCEKVTSCPITPITDCRMVVMPPNAAPASSPNRLVMLSCSGCSALATPPSSNSPSSAFLNTVNFSSPVSPNTRCTILSSPPNLSVRMLTTAMMLEITPTIGSAPDSRPPRPPAIGP